MRSKSRHPFFECFTVRCYVAQVAAKCFHIDSHSVLSMTALSHLQSPDSLSLGRLLPNCFPAVGLQVIQLLSSDHQVPQLAVVHR